MILQFIANGLAVGMAYALIAVGYSMVFGILRLINFSHGAVYAFGAHVVLICIGLNMGIGWGIAISIILTGLLAICVDKFGLAPLRKKNSVAVASLITTIGISYIIQNLLMALMGSERKSFPNIFGSGVLHLGSVTISVRQIYLFAIALTLLVILTCVVQKTKIGLAMRAVQQNTRAAHMMGIDVNFIISFTFFLGGVSAAIAGSLMAGYYELVYPTMGFMVGLKAFASAVLGGIGVLHGAVVGGLVVGVVEALASGYLGSSYRDAFAFIILIIILIIRPAGLFGKKGISKV